MGTGSFPGVGSGRGVTLTPHQLLVPRSKNRVELYLYSPLAYKRGETHLTTAWKFQDCRFYFTACFVHIYRICKQKALSPNNGNKMLSAG
jgi:hypothetical protein